MSKSSDVSWTPTVEQHIQLEEGFAILDEAETLLHDFCSLAPCDWQSWIESQQHCINEVRASFRFILSGDTSVQSWMFYSWITHPPSLLSEIRRVSHVFKEIEQKASEQCEHMGTSLPPDFPFTLDQLRQSVEP